MPTPTTDRGGIQQVIRALVADGWKLDSVWDGEEDLPVTNEKDAVEGIMQLDIAHLYVKYDGVETGWVFFVLGNDPDEVVNDYTTNLEDTLGPLFKTWW